MTRSKSPLQYAVRVCSYAELEHYVGAFAQGHLNLLLIIGPPGVGKSRCVRHAMTGSIVWIGGQAFPAVHLHGGLSASRSADHPRRRRWPVRRPAGVRLLKALAQTEPRKTEDAGRAVRE